MALSFYGHPLSSYCWKALIALYETATPFTFETVDFGDPDSVARFKAIWPMAKMPVLVDEARGVTVPEASLVIEYLDQLGGEPRFIPRDAEAAREVRLRDRFYDNYVMAPMQRIVADRLRPAGRRDPFGVEQLRNELRLAYDVADAALAGRAWAAGEAFSLADCAAAPALHYAGKVEPFGRSHPRLGGYLARLEARPSFARVLKEAEPYAHLFPPEPEPVA